MFSDRPPFQNQGPDRWRAPRRRFLRGSRITDFISLGVIAKTFPVSKSSRSILAETGKASVRERELPAHVMVYYVIALALYMNRPAARCLRCLLEGSSGCEAPGAESR